jgi:acetate kinase
MTFGPDGSCVLTINAGSSSVKVAVFRAGPTPRRLISAQVARIGLRDSELTIKDQQSAPVSQAVRAPDHAAAMDEVFDRLGDQAKGNDVAGAGHRIVHGGERYSAPVRINVEVISELRRISPFDPDHMPAAIDLIELVWRHWPNLPQVACFDTAFHSTMPRIAQIIPLPRKFEFLGVRRYGFHGLSYQFLMQELERLGGGTVARGKLILAHFGSGCSLAAVHEGRCLDTTMGFTSTAGMPMSTRSGDLDPGLVFFLAQAAGIAPQQFHDIVNHQSGLLGVSETSSDMRDLLEREARDHRAAEAVAMFCHHARKWIGALAAVLGGLDTLVFTGGIGENAPLIRARICEGLRFLGVAIDETRNAANAPVVSTDGSRAMVRVIRTDEESIIAALVSRLLNLGSAEPFASPVTS